MKYAGSCLVVLILAMPGCGGGTQSPGIAVVYNCPANAAEIAVLQREIPVFAESSGVRITLNPFTGQEKLYAMMAAGKAPDIFYTNATMRDQLAAEGRILDLRSVSTGDPFVDRLWPHVIRNGTAVDGGWYSVGNWEFTCGVYYRKDLFDAAGLSYPESSWVWEDFVATARALTVRPADGGTPTRYGVFIGSHFVEMLELMNGGVFPRDELFVSIPETSLEVYRRYRALMDEGLMPDLRRMQALGMQAPQLLQSGRVAMLVEAVPHQTLIEGLTSPWGVAPLPGFRGKQRSYFRSSSGGLSLSSSTHDPVAAWKALVWIIAGASIYQPNPVLRDVDFVGGWERRFPHLRESGFREVWDLSLQHNGGDPRYFVRYSSVVSGPIMEQLQPLLDRLWARELSVSDLAAAVPGINERIRAELSRAVKNRSLPAPVLEKVRTALDESHDATAR